MHFGSIFFKILDAGKLSTVLEMVNNKLANIAHAFKLPAILFYVLFAAAAIAVGIWGYKFIKLLTSASFAIVAGTIGYELFHVVKDHFGWEKIPDFCAYIVGALVLVLFAFLAYKKFSYALFAVMGVAGFLVSYFIIPNPSIAVAGAFGIALLSMFFVRHAFIILTSFGAGFVCMSMASAILPNVALISLSKGIVGFGLAIVVSCIFMAVQFYMSRGENKKKGPKRMKKRRVYDTW